MKNKFISYWLIPILMVVIVVVSFTFLIAHKDDDKLRAGVITSIEKGENGQCKYRVYISGWIHSWAIDSCGKFQIGDTIKIVKK